MRAAGPAVAALLWLAVYPAAADAPSGRLSAKDVKIYTEAFTAADRGDWRWVRRLTSRAGNRLPAKALRWMELGQPGNGASFARIAAFLSENPHWPRRKLLRRRAEEAITNATSAETLIAWFDENPPIGIDGLVARAEALLEAGDMDSAMAALKTAWIDGNFTRRKEYRFMRRHRRLFTRDDHMARLDRLLWGGKYRQALRMMRRIDKSYRPVALARIKLRLYRGGVDQAIARVPKSMRSDPGFLYERLRWRRRKRRDLDALEILNDPPDDLVHPERWWVERAHIARRILGRGMTKEAYDIAQDHGLKPGLAFAEAEWMSGWIALRFLNRAETAAVHFKRLFEAVTTPISRARGAYWSGRAAEALGKANEAKRWYDRASSYDGTFYGQLAAHRSENRHRPHLTPEPRPTGTDIASFNRNELVRLVLLLAELKQHDRMRPYIERLADTARTPGRLALAARLAGVAGRTDLAVKVARRAYRRNIPLMTVGFPVIQFPRAETEMALSLAVTRQESSFRVSARSHAGATGMMQIMPATARAVSRAIKERYSRSRLRNDPAYNIRLGQAYLGILLEQYQGSYVLTLAGYNAGPKSVNRWLRRIGDPRIQEVDVIDWIEMIPYSETRNYVQRVLENLHVYRRLLGQPKSAASPGEFPVR